MAYYKFIRAIPAGEKIRVFNHGNLERDFTYIDDIKSGILAVSKVSPDYKKLPYRPLNLGNNAPVKLDFFIEILEKLLSTQKKKELVDMQPGDVHRTCADMELANNLVDDKPRTRIQVDLKNSVDWYHRCSA